MTVVVFMIVPVVVCGVIPPMAVLIITVTVAVLLGKWGLTLVNLFLHPAHHPPLTGVTTRALPHHTGA